MENEEKIKKINEVIDNIKPYLNSDGGNIEFINYDNGVVFIKLTGACGCCAYRDETIQNGILKSLQSEIPEITDVINVEI